MLNVQATVGSAHGVWGCSVVRRWMTVIAVRAVYYSTVEQLCWIVHRPQCSRASAGFWLGGYGGQCPLAAWGEENSENLTTKWCILKYIWINCGQHSAVLYTCLPWLLSKYNVNIKMSSMIPPTASLFRSSGELVWSCVYNACILVRGSRGPDIPQPPGAVHVNRA